MVKVVANRFIREECLEEYLRLVEELVKRTNENDPGCITYELCRSQRDPLHFAMLEEWETPEDLANHSKSAHCQELIPQISSFSSKDPQISIFDKLF